MSKSEAALGSCCLCIPLRYGVLLIAFLTFLESFVFTLGLFTDDFRLHTGGFDVFTRYIVGIVGVSGLIFSLTGMVGCYDSNASSIRAFWYFTVFQIAAVVFIFGVDWVVLSRCESWRWSISAKSDFNPTLFAISRVRGACGEVRTSYAWNFVEWMVVTSFFSYTVWRLSELLLSGPTYLIRFEKDLVRQPLRYKSAASPSAAAAEQP